jgi:POT family proton-dependent oligopeptide transporter
LFRCEDAQVSAATVETSGRWLGFPKGAWLIIGVEFWERFSFYGMMSILALFLTASPTNGGFGWTVRESLALVGWYTFSMYAFPALGGYLADRVFGRRRGVAIGTTFMLFGQVMLASPVFLPEFLGWLHGAPLLQGLHELGVPLGQWVGSDAVQAAILRRGPAIDANAGVTWLRQAYAAAAFGFYGAILSLIVGNALMKSTLVVLCGETMSPDDPRREGAFAYYYVGITIGALLSGFVVGSVAQAYGWHFGFAVAAVGMTIAFGAYALFSNRWLGDIGIRPDREREHSTAGNAGIKPVSEPADVALYRICLLLLLALLLCAFSIGWFQLYGSWLLFIERDVNRTFLSFSIPVPWFTSINAAVVFACAPLVSALWVRLARRNRRIDIVQKYIFALSTITAAHVLFYFAALHAGSPGQALIWAPLAAISVIGVGELVAWTGTYGMVSRAAPTGFASVAMGAWYLLTLGLGGYLSGLSGRLIDSLGFANTFGIIALCMGAACVTAMLVRAPLARLAVRAGVTL